MAIRESFEEMALLYLPRLEILVPPTIREFIEGLKSDLDKLEVIVERFIGISIDEGSRDIEIRLAACNKYLFFKRKIAELEVLDRCARAYGRVVYPRYLLCWELEPQRTIVLRSLSETGYRRSDQQFLEQDLLPLIVHWHKAIGVNLDYPHLKLDSTNSTRCSTSGRHSNSQGWAIVKPQEENLLVRGIANNYLLDSEENKNCWLEQGLEIFPSYMIRSNLAYEKLKSFTQT